MCLRLYVGQCFRVDVIDDSIDEIFKHDQPSCALYNLIVNSIENLDEEVEDEIEKCLLQFETLQVDDVNDKKKEDLKKGEVEEKVSPELKQLLPHLKYVFLGEDALNPVIISSSLSKLEEEKLIRVLREYKKTIGWTISDLKGISPSFCMHKIMLEDEFKPVVQPQRRLNPTMKEVVRKEVLKLLEAGMIYPISDSAWVSPVQVVPKKEGMTVVKNDKNELVPQEHSRDGVCV